MVLNNRFLRLILHKNLSFNTTDLYSSFGTLPIDKLFKSQLLLHAHNIFYHPESLPKIFIPLSQLNADVHDHHTRSKSDFHRTSSISSFSSKISYNLYAKLWNSLSTEVKSVVGHKQFKRSIQSLLLDSAF